MPQKTEFSSIAEVGERLIEANALDAELRATREIFAMAVIEAGGRLLISRHTQERFDPQRTVLKITQLENGTTMFEVVEE